jgi:hypothetical protein
LREQEAEQYLACYFPPEYQPTADLFAEYRRKVREEAPSCGEHHSDGAAARLIPSGDPMPEVVRRAYARHAPAVDGDLAAVFARAVSVLEAPSKTRRELPDLPISVLCDEIWQHHSNLRYRFDVEQESGRLAYLRWLVDQGAAELGIPTIFLEQARLAVNRQRIRELESDDEPIELSPPPGADPDVPQPPATSDALAGLIAAHDAERDRMRRLQADIRLLVSSNKSLRRDVLSLRVRRWRDEETIHALEDELAQTRDALKQRSQKLARLRIWFGLPFADWLRRSPRPSTAEIERRELLEGDGPFFRRGFLVGETAAIVGTTVQRIKSAPSGTMIFGPYINLPTGRYAVTIDARLYQRLPLLANFKVDVVCNGAQRIVEARRFHLHSLARWRRFELVFSVRHGQGYPDFEIRIWARKQTPLEIGRIGIYELAGKTGTVLAA